MKKRVLRFCLGALVLLLVALGAALADFYLWRSNVVEGIETDQRRRIESTMLGDVEFAIQGDGVPVLVLHGSLGGFDAALQVADRIRGAQVIAVSRPGYLGTPLSSGASYDEQADLFAALLDELGIEDVVVYAASAGGNYGVRFALRHPGRTAGLVLVSTGGLEADSENAVPDLGKTTLFFADIYMWASARFFPSLLGSTLSGDFDSDDPEQVAQVARLAKTLVPMGSRWQGNYNDGIQSTNPAIDDWVLEEITVPTLIIHGDRDPMAPYEGARTVAGRIPGSVLLTLEGAGHATFTNEQHGRISAAVTSLIEVATTEDR